MNGIVSINASDSRYKHTIPDPMRQKFIAVYAQDMITLDFGDISIREATSNDVAILRQNFATPRDLPSTELRGFVVTYANVLAYTQQFEVQSLSITFY